MRLGAGRVRFGRLARRRAARLSPLRHDDGRRTMRRIPLIGLAALLVLAAGTAAFAKTRPVRRSRRPRVHACKHPSGRLAAHRLGRPGQLQAARGRRELERGRAEGRQGRPGGSGRRRAGWACRPGRGCRSSGAAGRARAGGPAGAEGRRRHGRLGARDARRHAVHGRGRSGTARSTSRSRRAAPSRCAASPTTTPVRPSRRSS